MFKQNKRYTNALWYDWNVTGESIVGPESQWWGNRSYCL